MQTYANLFLVGVVLAYCFTGEESTKSHIAKGAKFVLIGCGVAWVITEGIVLLT